MGFDCSGLSAYSGYFTNTQKLLRSASGGGASVISQSVIRNGGAVFGACYSHDFRTAEFACIESPEDLDRLKGSKYIPTLKRVMLDGEYVPLWPLVAEKLKAGREVLFTGLGCDVAALKSFLNANHVDSSRLYTVDLICYGPALQEVHQQYIEMLEKKYHSRIKSFTVRHKAKGWTPPYIRAEFEDSRKFITPFHDSDYGMAFSVYTREQCSKCRFKGANHQADITVGDYWGMTPEMSGWNSNGVSIFLVRTEKGQELLRRIDPQEFALRPEDADFVVRNNPMYYESRKRPEDYGKFCDDLESAGLHRAVVKHFGRMNYYKMKVKSCIKKCIPAPAKRLIKAILRRH